jgi:hypothetical protein
MMGIAHPQHILYFTRIRGLNPPHDGGLFLGWGLNPHPKNLAFNFQLSTFNFLTAHCGHKLLTWVAVVRLSIDSLGDKWG